MIAVTFYTPAYADLVEGWQQSVEQVGELSGVAVNVTDKGSWRENVGRKPGFVLRMFEAHRQPILWVDVDARFRSAWDLDLSGYDFAAYFIDAGRMPDRDKPHGKYDGIASGTMYFGFTKAAQEFLSRWIAAEHGQHRYGQIVLGEVWHTARPLNLRTFQLPQRYLKVFDRPWYDGEGGGPAIIEHLQASRQKRRKVDSQK